MRARHHFDLGEMNLIEHKNSVILRRGRDKQSKMNDDESIFPNRCAFLNFDFIAACAIVDISSFTEARKIVGFLGLPLNLAIIAFVVLKATGPF